MNVKTFFEKQSVGFYVGAAAVLFMLIGTIILSTNCNMEYYQDYTAVVPLLGSLAVIAGVALLAAQQFVKIPHLDAIWIVSVILMAAALMIMISMRVESMAYILGSDLENDNPIAKPALNNFFAGAAIALVGIIAAVVAAFFSTVKEKANA